MIKTCPINNFIQSDCKYKIYYICRSKKTTFSETHNVIYNFNVVHQLYFSTMSENFGFVEIDEF